MHTQAGPGNPPLTAQCQGRPIPNTHRTATTLPEAARIPSVRGASMQTTHAAHACAKPHSYMRPTERCATTGSGPNRVRLLQHTWLGQGTSPALLARSAGSHAETQAEARLRHSWPLWDGAWKQERWCAGGHVSINMWWPVHLAPYIPSSSGKTSNIVSSRYTLLHSAVQNDAQALLHPHMEPAADR